MRVSHDIPTNVAFVSFSFVRQLLECLMTFVRMLLGFIFSPHSHEVFSCVFLRLLHDIRTSVLKYSHCKFTKRSQRQIHDTPTIVVRLLHHSLATYFGEKICITFLNIFKTLVTSSRHMKILMTLVRHSHKCHTKSMQLNSQNSREKFLCQ